MVTQITTYGPHVINNDYVNCFSHKIPDAFCVHVGDYFKHVLGPTHILVVNIRVFRSFIKYGSINRSFTLRLHNFDTLRS